VFGARSKPELTPGEGLGAKVRRRLDLFARAFDELNAKTLVLFAGPSTPDDVMASAMKRADEVLQSGLERAATKEAVQLFVKSAQVRLVEEFGISKLLGMGSNQMPSADDRVRVFKSLERAVVALVVWDRLDPSEQAALVGPWRDLVERAVEP
jgi:cytosine/adenosine deaminase-related metal-dependent hydrolase